LILIAKYRSVVFDCFFFQEEDGIRDDLVRSVLFRSPSAVRTRRGRHQDNAATTQDRTSRPPALPDRPQDRRVRLATPLTPLPRQAAMPVSRPRPLPRARRTIRNCLWAESEGDPRRAFWAR